MEVYTVDHRQRLRAHAVRLWDARMGEKTTRRTQINKPRFGGVFSFGDRADRRRHGLNRRVDMQALPHAMQQSRSGICYVGFLTQFSRW
jgi:hypothetical protein